MKNYLQDLRNVAMLVMDFDGVHTDGFVYIDEQGRETVRCSRRDGLGLEMLKKIGIKLFVISKEKNPVVAMRCNKLGIEYYQGVSDASDKKEIMETLLKREGVLVESVVYVGDDVNDVDALRYAGTGVVVADAHEDLKRYADIILTRNGGSHALRELCDYILTAKRDI